MPEDRGPQPVYLPSNEPYLGRELVFHFDQIIMSCLEVNADVSACTHRIQLSDLQKAACQLIPQGVNLSLTIRELVRQGYLFSALVLLRPLIERVAIISYLQANPSEIAVWNDGWRHNDKKRPSLAEMLETMSGSADIEVAKRLTYTLNHLVHGDPLAADWNLTELGDGGMGYSVGKVIDNPDLCDFICSQTICYVVVLMGMMVACFPESAPGK
jgi:hypothetical protein